MVTAFQRGAFQFSAFQIAAAVGWPDDMPLHLLRHNPAELERRLAAQRPFNRKQFDQLVAAERAAAEAERKANGLKLARERERALKAARRAKAVVQVERQKATAPERVSYADAAAAQRVLEIQLALDAFNSARSVSQRMQATNELQSAADAIRRRQQAEEDDDAMALELLL